MPTPWRHAQLVAALLAAAPEAFGGVVVRAAAGPVRDRWLQGFRALRPPTAAWVHVPAGVSEARLLGGLDLAATLALRTPVAEAGLMQRADGGVLVLSMAERQAPATAALVAAALDDGRVPAVRGTAGSGPPARFCCVALDESLPGDAGVPTVLVERLAFALDLDGVPLADTATPWPAPDAQLDLNTLFALSAFDDGPLGTLCGLALGFGIDSLRAPLQAWRAARAIAALDGQAVVEEAHLVLAAGLVFGHRARQLPGEASSAEAGGAPQPAQQATSEHTGDDASGAAEEPPVVEERVVDAVKVILAPELLASLAAGRAGRSRARERGRGGQWQAGAQRGRPLAARRGLPGRGEKLDLVATLQAAAPWQRARRTDARAGFQIRKDDLRTRRFRHRARATTVFVVDASGSSAHHRLAEAKGAVELLLAECYVRRDQVAMIAFRGQIADLLLPPTRSLVRAKRCLAALPGGGGTPLGAAIAAAGQLAESVRRGGATPLVVLFTDGRANVARDGTLGRAAGEADATAAARGFAQLGLGALLVDTSPRPAPLAAHLAAQLQASYLALPHADSKTLALAVQQAQRREAA